VRAVVQALVKADVGAALEDLEGNDLCWRGSDKWADMEMMAMGASAFAGLGTTQEAVKKALSLLCKVLNAAL
jgi:SET and MYND domain-containing protein